MYFQLFGLDKPPTNYYQLLNLPAHEADRQLIQQQLVRATKRLRAAKPHAGQVDEPQYRQAWAIAVQELKRAEATLLDEGRKQRYDAKLAERLAGRRERRPTVQRAGSIGPPAEDPMMPAEVSANSTNGDPPASDRDPMAPIGPDQLAPPLTAPAPPPLTKNTTYLPDDASHTSANELNTLSRSPAPNPLPSFDAAIPRSSVSARLRHTRTTSRKALVIYVLTALIVITAFGFLFNVLGHRGFRARRLANANSPDSSQDMPFPDGPDSAHQAASDQVDRVGPSVGTGRRDQTNQPVATSLRPAELTVRNDGIGESARERRTNDHSESLGNEGAKTQAPSPQSPSVNRLSTNVPPSAKNDATANQSDPRRDSTATPSNQPQRENPDAPPPSANQLADSERLEVYSTLAMAREALRNGKPERARRLTRQATKLAGDSPLADMANRLDLAADYVQQYWEAYQESLQSLKGVDLSVDGHLVHVVDIDANQLTVRDRGQPRRWRLDELPSQYVMAIAARGFNANASSTGVFRGAFMWATGEFSDEEVRRVWQLARVAGADVGDLMLLLDDQYNPNQSN